MSLVGEGTVKAAFCALMTATAVSISESMDSESAVSLSNARVSENSADFDYAASILTLDPSSDVRDESFTHDPSSPKKLSLIHGMWNFFSHNSHGTHDWTSSRMFKLRVYSYRNRREVGFSHRQVS